MLRRLATLALVSGVALSATAAQNIKIGVFLPMSGDQSSFGDETMSGVKMAVEEINAGKDFKIELFTQDEKSNPTDSANAVKKLINVDKVDVVVGTVASSNTNAAAPIAQAAKVPLMSPTSTNVKVTDVGEYVSRICFIDDFQGSAMAKFALKPKAEGGLGAKTAVLVIDSSSEYSKGLSAAFREVFTKNGGKIDNDGEIFYVQKDRDFSSLLTKIKRKKPDVVFAPGYYTEIGNMIRQAHTFGITAKFLGGDGWSAPQLFTLAGEKAIVGHYFSDHFSHEDTDPAVQDFVKRYRAKYGKDAPGMAALGYDSIRVVIDAAKRAGKVERTALMKAINSTKGFKGVTGVITLDAKRNANKPLVILETQKDRATFKTRVNP